MGRATIRRWRESQVDHAKMLERAPEPFTTSRPITCVVCETTIEAGQPALHKIRVGVAHRVCGAAAWGTHDAPR